jgi:hypothetical protein
MDRTAKEKRDDEQEAGSNVASGESNTAGPDSSSAVVSTEVALDDIHQNMTDSLAGAPGN